MKRAAMLVCAGAGLIAAVVPGAANAGNAGSPDRSEGLSAAESARLDAGVQLAPLRSGATGPSPFTAYLPDLHKTNFAAWVAKVAKISAAAATTPERQAAKARWSGASDRAVLSYREKEAATVIGANDTTWKGEKVSAFGLGAGLHNRMVVSGTLADKRPALRSLPMAKEDNGSIPKAAATGIDGNGRVKITGRIGDGPYGTSTGDFDWYKLTAKPGETVGAAIPSSSLDVFGLLVDGHGTVLDVAWHTPDGSLPDKTASTTSAAGGTYYLLLLHPNTWQMDFSDSASGTGAANSGNYTAEFGAYRTDRDAVLVKLRRGDVLGTSVTGAAGRVSVQKWDSPYVTASSQSDTTAYYPPNSPLPGGGNAATAYVAEADGWYGVITETGIGAYRNAVEVYRPGGESTSAPQTIYLDFDGASINTSIFGGPDMQAKLSPLSSFLKGWGLTQADLPALTDAITKTVTENLRDDMRRKNIPNLNVRIVNGRTSPDTFGRPNVSRVIVGGTIDESQIPTVGIAEHIDPGNYGREDTALVLQDLMSAPVKGNQSAVVSLNYYLRPGVGNKVQLIGRAVGNVVAHEVGHYIGNWHTDNSNSVKSIMDSGGRGFWRMFNAGPDWVLGTADDGDTDFTTDRYSLNEPFFGREDTANVTAWAFSGKR